MIINEHASRKILGESLAIPAEFSDFVQVLNALSSVVVMLGVLFVVLQLRQNARLIETSNKQVHASIEQNRSNVAFSIVERFTEDSFTVRRKTIRDIVKKYEANKWEGFPETSEDYEVRAFGSYYEFTAYLAKTGIVDLKTLQDVLGHRVTFDWDAFSPVVEYYRESWGKKYIFTNFQWLADATRKYMEKKEQELKTT